MEETKGGVRRDYCVVSCLAALADDTWIIAEWSMEHLMVRYCMTDWEVILGRKACSIHGPAIAAAISAVIVPLEWLLCMPTILWLLYRSSCSVLLPLAAFGGYHFFLDSDALAPAKGSQDQECGAHQPKNRLSDLCQGAALI